MDLLSCWDWLRREAPPRLHGPPPLCVDNVQVTRLGSSTLDHRPFVLTSCWWFMNQFVAFVNISVLYIWFILLVIHISSSSLSYHCYRLSSTISFFYFGIKNHVFKHFSNCRLPAPNKLHSHTHVYFSHALQLIRCRLYSLARPASQCCRRPCFADVAFFFNVVPLIWQRVDGSPRGLLR